MYCLASLTLSSVYLESSIFLFIYIKFFRNTIIHSNLKQSALFSYKGQGQLSLDKLTSPAHFDPQLIVIILIIMSRSQPYRSRIPTHIIQLLDVASRITLFLVGQSGPLCFTFKDRLDNKYKTSIGPDLKCTCSPNRNDHCIHTAYIFLKIFRVSVDNPIIWQPAYVDSQLTDLVSWKHTMPQARRARPNFDIAALDIVSELPSEWIKKREKVPEPKTVVTSERMEMQADSVCPICQEAMTAEMCISFCKVKCGNNFHLQCLKVWARHRIQQQALVSCPMCRCKFPATIMQQLEHEERIWAKEQTQKLKIQFDCSGCGLKNIPNNPHKCVLCTSFQLCECCYATKKHVKHPFMRRDSDGRWRGAEERREDELKLKNYIDSKRKQTYNDQILQKIRKIDEDPNKLIDYIASAYPYVSRYITQKIDPMKKMDFDPADIRCFKCGSTRMLFLRRLACGHFVDHQCLKDCISKEKFYCQEDGTQFLKGFENLRQKEKEMERKRNHQIIKLTPYEFDPRNMEDQPQISANDYNFVRSNEETALDQILSSRGQREVESIQRTQQRLVNNIIRENRSVSRQKKEPIQVPARESQIKQAPRRIALKSRQKPPIARPNQIRIRNVGNSIGKPKSQAQSATIHQKSERKRRSREELTTMFEALIGRKLK